MSDKFRYITLISSLPYLGKLFSQKSVPVSEFRLRERLKMLDDGHKDLLEKVISVTAWAGVAKLDTDADVVRLAETVIDAVHEYPALQDLVRVRMETRTIIAALRRRQHGDQSAGDIHTWGYGRWRTRISDNWSDPSFGMGHFMPWIAEANGLMRKGDHIAMERLSLTEVFRQLDRQAATHAFDFEAVVIYVLRWTIVQRWSTYNGEAAATRLRKLIDQALKTAPDLPGPPLGATQQEEAPA
ncbi:uncharacterized protein DUF2764 [Roseibium hamelinense]|uniref:Uncharacterized protein DUF2764 n=1 Tax=Roseibium hamelinense TaxID=150831 RepID=A0A562SYE6_9HYPH|nr:DUF2764 family protein [Roseibium hamelinense]MTI44881.1 DUF2764 family protein [Roseibium hamelinense]TWI85924.1 uncharacterized protein DUF2764 [Roseibium hamelinense]